MELLFNMYTCKLKMAEKSLFFFKRILFLESFLVVIVVINCSSSQDYNVLYRTSNRPLLLAAAVAAFILGDSIGGYSNITK